jgi:hypothetical protein
LSRVLRMLIITPRLIIRTNRIMHLLIRIRIVLLLLIKLLLITIILISHIPINITIPIMILRYWIALLIVIILICLIGSIVAIILIILIMIRIERCLVILFHFNTGYNNLLSKSKKLKIIKYFVVLFVFIYIL